MMMTFEGFTRNAIVTARWLGSAPHGATING
jgi:hypothetical protein